MATFSVFREVRDKLAEGASKYPDLTAVWTPRPKGWTLAKSCVGYESEHADPAAVELFTNAARLAVRFLGKSTDTGPAFHILLDLMRNGNWGFKYDLKPRTFREFKRLVESQGPTDTSDIPTGDSGSFSNVFQKSLEFWEEIEPASVPGLDSQKPLATVEIMSRETHCWICCADLGQTLKDEHGYRICVCGFNQGPVPVNRQFEHPAFWMRDLIDQDNRIRPEIEECSLRKALVEKYFQKPDEISDAAIRCSLKELMWAFESFGYVPNGSPMVRNRQVEIRAEDGDLWRGLEERFRSILAPQLEARWTFTPGPTESEEWLVDWPLELRQKDAQQGVDRFCSVAGMAAIRLGFNDYGQWLDVIRREVGGLKRKLTGEGGSGSFVVGVIERIVNVSADFCIELERKALIAKSVSISQNATKVAVSGVEKRKRGRPSPFSDALKDEACKLKQSRASNAEVAALLYRKRYPDPQQVKNVTSILKHYKKSKLKKSDLFGTEEPIIR